MGIPGNIFLFPCPPFGRHFYLRYLVKYNNFNQASELEKQSEVWQKVLVSWGQFWAAAMFTEHEAGILESVVTCAVITAV